MAPTPTLRRDRPAELDNVGTDPAVSGLKITEYGFGPVRITEFEIVDSGVALTLTDEAGVVLYGGVKVYDFPEGVIDILSVHTDLDFTYSGNVNADADGDFGMGTVTATNTAIASKTAGAAEHEIMKYQTIPQASASVTTGNFSSREAIAALTDNAGGSETPDGTISEIADIALSTSNTYTDAAVNTAVNAVVDDCANAIEELATKVNEIIHAMNGAKRSVLDGRSTAIDLYWNFLIDDADHNGGVVTISGGKAWVIWMHAGND